MCLAKCTDATECPSGSCVSGVCDALHDADSQVTIDTDTQFQSLIGFGASFAFFENDVAASPERAALYDALFTDLGANIIRLRNAHDGGTTDNLPAVADIVAAATERLGRAPTLLMTQGSPPAALKANANRSCGGDTDVCTLATAAAGGFEYAAFAEHWRTSLDAYAAAGIEPDYLSLQNNPDWSPPAAEAKEACRFLPEEGSQEVELEDGSIVTATYPGYAEALAAVKEALAATHPDVRFMAPEVGSIGPVETYVSHLDSAAYDAVAFHLYATDPNAIDGTLFTRLGEVGRAAGHPLLQTEMRADGMTTAILLHYTLAEAGAAAYLQNDFVTLAADSTGSTALAAMANGSVEPLDPYHAMRHFSRFTGPGWTRVSSSVDTARVLTSAWLSPDSSSLSVVLVNPNAETAYARVAAPGAWASSSAEVTRTTFDGVERSTHLGALGSDRVVSLPGHSLVTVAFELAE